MPKHMRGYVNCNACPLQMMHYYLPNGLRRQRTPMVINQYETCALDFLPILTAVQLRNADDIRVAKLYDAFFLPLTVYEQFEIILCQYEGFCCQCAKL